MNIKRAKQEIKDTIEAYLEKDEFGQYRIPEAGPADGSARSRQDSDHGAGRI